MNAPKEIETIEKLATIAAKAVSLLLKRCPFCKGKANFMINRSGQIILQHHPESGVQCPARYESYCESFEQGLGWWNTRKWWKKP